MNNKVCPNCNQPPIKIDHHGEVLIGCIECNYWRDPADKRFILEMTEDDLKALRARERQKHSSH